MKIKLTKEQINSLIGDNKLIVTKADKEYLQRTGDANYIYLHDPGFYKFSTFMNQELEISDDQVIKEKTNMEKWIAVIIRLIEKDNFKRPVLVIAKTFDELGYNADAAYKEVCK